MPVAMRCFSFMARPVNQKPNRLRRPEGTWSLRSRTSSLFALFAGVADETLGDAGNVVTLDGTGCAIAAAGAAAGAGCTAACAGACAGEGAVVAGWSGRSSAALSIIEAL